MTIYDTIIIGGGPAGQSAAIYLARFNRSVLVIDRGTSRTLTYELNENYLGFPEGIHSRQLYELGRKQAERFGVTFTSDDIHSIRNDSSFFTIEGAEHYQAKTLILATGVTDLYPNISNHQEYLGKSLFWCITCDGLKTQHKKLVIIGDTDEAACTALQFFLYTKDVTMITNYETKNEAISDTWKQQLKEHHVPIHEQIIKQFHGTNGQVTAIELNDGQQIPADIIFNLQGAVPNNFLATELGVQVDKNGYVLVSPEQRTNVPKVYAAGDITGAFSHQIVTAAHEGSMAAQAANYDLYEDWQRI